jgi:hypothetical protein
MGVAKKRPNFIKAKIEQLKKVKGKQKVNLKTKNQKYKWRDL